MRKTSLLLLVCIAAVCAFGQTEVSSSLNPSILGVTWAKGAHQIPLARGSVNMTYHGGKIMPTANIAAIFWGTSWGDLLPKK